MRSQLREMCRIIQTEGEDFRRTLEARQFPKTVWVGDSCPNSLRALGLLRFPCNGSHGLRF